LSKSVVVSGSGPLTVFAKLNLLPLLPELYGRVLITESVYTEVVTVGQQRGFEDAERIRSFWSQMGWQPLAIDAEVAVPSLRSVTLDRGEKDRLALALPLKRALVLMDESAGRAVARSHGIPVRDSLGILIEAYRNQIINEPDLRFYFAEIERRQDIWINRTLLRRLLHEVLTS
jgi:predicted nucleic acid-binding protein